MKSLRLMTLLVLSAICVVGVSAQQDRQAMFKKMIPTHRDVRYAPSRLMLQPGDSTSDRLLDLYIPATKRPATGYPLVVFIHGGGFSGGDKAIYSYMAGMVDSLNAHGYAVASVNYYLTRKFTSAAQDDGGDLFTDAAFFRAVDDATTDAIFAMRYLDDHAAEYGLDTKRLALIGGSAGAITAIYAAFAKSPEKPRVRALVDCWGGIHDPMLVTDANLPVLIIHGTADDIIPYAKGAELHHRLKEIGSRQSRMITMEGLGHAQYPYVARTLMPEVVSFLDESLNN